MQALLTRSFLAVAALLFIVPSAHAATIMNANSLIISSSTPDNAYYGAGSLTVNAALPEDLSAAAGNISVAAPIGGDVLLAGGTIDVQKPVGRNARIAGGRITIENTINGDLMVAGGFVTVSGRAKDTHIAGGTVDLTGGSNGPVVIYATDAYLSGEFNGDVKVVASDKVTIADGTIIHGTFKYNAPQQASIPDSVKIDGGVTYIGSAAFLPTPQEAKTFAVAGLWVFLFVKIIALVVVVGLIAGLFPALTRRVVEKSLTRSPERFILLTFLGLAGFVAPLLLIVLLLVSFVGIGIALILAAAYFLFLLLAYTYASVLAGAAVLRMFRKNSHVQAITWRGAVFGAVVLFAIGYIPVVGFLVRVVLSATAGGALLLLFYRFAFRTPKSHLEV